MKSLILASAALAAAIVLPTASAFAALDTQAVTTAPVKLPKLKVGDAAPALTVEKWVKGEPVPSFQKGKVYMIEFWATWCGPCIQSMPHISELQKKYRAQGLTIIGMTSTDSRGNSLEKVEKMVAEKGDVMGYSVAWDTERKTNADFMAAAEQGGIPCSYLIDQNGLIAYIGHPMQIDAVLEQVVTNKHDIKALTATYIAGKELDAKAAPIQKKLNEAAKAKDWDAAVAALDELLALDAVKFAGMGGTKFNMLLNSANQAEKAMAFGREFATGGGKDNGQFLNMLAWSIVDPEGKLAAKADKKDLELAFSAATRANELAKGESPEVLDTLARVLFLKGEVKQAIETQTKAIGRAEKNPTLKKQLEGSLEEYKKAAAGKANG